MKTHYQKLYQTNACIPRKGMMFLVPTRRRNHHHHHRDHHSQLSLPWMLATYPQNMSNGFKWVNLDIFQPNVWNKSSVLKYGKWTKFLETLVATSWQVLWPHFVFLRLAPLAKLSGSGMFRSQGQVTWSRVVPVPRLVEIRKPFTGLPWSDFRNGNKVSFLQNHGFGYNHVAMATLHAKFYVSQCLLATSPMRWYKFHFMLTFFPDLLGKPNFEKKSIHFTSAKRFL